MRQGVVLVVALIAGCTGGDIEPAPAVMAVIAKAPVPCTPGDSEMCTASDGRAGTRICLGTVHIWSPCLSGSYCGDGTCDASDFETRTGCADDCAVCGDGYCDGFEDRDSCSYDCLPVECTPDESYCDGEKIRLCASDGATSALLEDCAVSAGGGPFSACVECPATEALACGAAVPLVTGTTAGVLDATPLTYFERFACPGEGWADTHYDPDDGLSIEIMLPSGDSLAIWIGWWVLIDGRSLPFSFTNIAYPYLMIDASTSLDAWANTAACWQCSLPPQGSLTVSWVGDLEQGAIVHVYGAGGMTANAGQVWDPLALDLYLLVL